MTHRPEPGTHDALRWVLTLMSEDAEQALRQLHLDASWVVPGPAQFGGGVHSGMDEIAAFLFRVIELFPQGLQPRTVHHTLQGPAHGTVEVTLAGLTATGASYTNRYVFSVHFADGLVTQIVEYCDTAYACDILGPATLTTA